MKSRFLFPSLLNFLVAGLVLSPALGSVCFDKEEAQGSLACGDLLNVADGTIEFWFKPATDRNNEWIMSKSKSAAQQMVIGFGPEDFMFMVRAGEWTYATVAKEFIAVGEWHHVACTFRKDQAAIFIDGTGYRNCQPGAYGLAHLAGGEFVIGRGTVAGERFNGLVAEVRLSNGVRYTEDFRPPSAPFTADQHTVALWHLDEPGGDRFADAGPGQHHARADGVVGRRKESPFTPTAQGKGTGRLPCYRAGQAPVIDGKLDDACWTTAATAVDFLDLNGGGWTSAARQTKVRAVYDDQQLYLAAACYEPDMANLVVQATERDGAVYKDDCLEIFLDPKGDGQGYFHYIFNALGAYCDGMDGDSAWNSKIRVAAKRLNDRWELEAAIPFQELRTQPPAEGKQWGFNAAREHRAGQHESLSTWSVLTEGAFHKPAEFARLAFVGPAPATGGREFSNRKLGIKNGMFVEKDEKNTPVGWQLGSQTKCQETVYLSGVYALTTSTDHALARQEMNFGNVAGKKFEFSVDARGEQEARLGVALGYVTDEGQAEQLRVFWDEPLAGDYATHKKIVAIPRAAQRVTSIEICRSNDKGTLSCSGVNVGDLSEFREIKEATDVIAEHTRPVGEPFVAAGITRWATPLAGGPLNVLFVVDFTGIREAIELSQRLEMKYDLCWLYRDVGYAYGAKQINARLCRKGQPYDVIILSAELKNKALARVIKENVQAGTGLVYVQAGTGLVHLRSQGDFNKLPDLQGLLPKLTELKPGGDEPELVRNSAWSCWPVMPANYVFSGNEGEPALRSAGVADQGRGRVVVLRYGKPGGTIGLIPWTGINPSELDRWWEQAYALLARCARVTAKRVPVARIDVVEPDVVNATLKVGLGAAKNFEGTLAAAWSDKRQVVAKEATAVPVAIAAGQTAIVAVEVPAAARHCRGLYAASLMLKDKHDKAVDWATGLLEIKGPVRIGGQHPLARDWFRTGETIAGQVSIENQGTAETAVACRLELIDFYQRCVWRETQNLVLAAGQTAQVAVAPQTDRAVTAFHRLCATLLRENRIIDRQEWAVGLRDKWKYVLDDFQLGANGDFFRRAPTDFVFAEFLRGCGITFSTDGSPFESAPALNLPWTFVGLCHQPFHYFNANGPIRKPCLNDPRVLKEATAGAIEALEARLKNGVVFAGIGDELELSRDGRAEVCFCPRCQERFRGWVKERYGRLEKLNAEWGTQHKTWEEIVPVLAEEARKRGNFAPWVDFRVFMEDVWINAFLAVKSGLKQKHPDVLVSFCNPFILNPFSGSDHYKSAKAEDVYIKYARPDIIKEYQRFNPTAPMQTYFGYLEDLPCCKWYPWWFAFNGGDLLLCYYCSHSQDGLTIFNVSASHTQRSQEIIKSSADLLKGAGKILHDFPPAKNPVVMLYSQPSMHLSWIASDLKLGLAPWSDSVDGMEKLPIRNPFGLNYRSGMHFKAMLKETALQPDFVVPEEILQGKLNGYRMLILPFAPALSDEVLAKIAEFVQRGGTVLADLQAATHSDHGRPITPRPAFETLFGFRRTGQGFTAAEAELTGLEELAGLPPAKGLDRGASWEALVLTTAKAKAKHKDGAPAVTVNDCGNGKAIYLNFVPGNGPSTAALMDKVLALAGIEREIHLTKGEGLAFGYECFPFQRGPVKYLGILRDMTPPPGKRPSWGGSTFQHGTPGKETVTVRLADQRHVYDVRAGQYLGAGQSFPVQLEASDAALLALLPYQVTKVTISGMKKRLKPGETLSFEARVKPSAGQAGDHVLRIEVRNPRGEVVPCYTRHVVAPNGQFKGEVPLALDETPGAWALMVIDVASKLSASRKFSIAK